MKTQYIVCDAGGDVSYNDRSRSPETFTRFRGPKGAAARAMELAKASPGLVIRVYELTAEAVAPVQPVEVGRKHPTEHYK